MRYYETLYIVNPNFEDKRVETIISEVGVELQKTNSKTINHHVWGKKRLAYPIQKQKYGTFILMQYAGGETGSMAEFDTWLKLNTSVLRHLTTRLEVEPPKIDAPVFEKTEEKATEKPTLETEETVETKEAPEEAPESSEDESIDDDVQEVVAEEKETSEETVETEEAPEEVTESDDTEKETE
ncbi:MAG: 30S ribosomal protein S6 [Candidatus Marinimicrobia bacterium]|jgi:small subunit ribosomal protein S6|nr:30S ribosomal protein S6 [Candidatus Neomarinimicrobiota bacterium]MBT3937011.1 30S ribosomal protein S6 [Candidatus Neomarinimicrobiota bacterium]MBT3960597.1 30S ribosomal protein S6 [Candidatus Neomarinimicrobiota bacterium]MBT4383120.1 30S ribosomal protein S6 [Candidatus Neomarinimicrobiota bacterium]MBT4636296.1 30S ribosomal protein S6 [Candidatus Neomarinimicrobiota bacterium]|tara:strand:+ start:109 stop:657 length:549 start_codon:yes stop_codon:yes gene_type:complete